MRNNSVRFRSKGILGGLGILLLLAILRSFTIINAGERGVVMLNGQVQKTILDEGIHPILPIVTQVKKISVRVQKTDVSAAAASRDLQDINADIAINWHIDPARVNEVFQRVGDLNTIITSIINPAVSEVVKASVPRRNVSDTLQQRAELKEELDTALKRRLAPYGVVVDDVSLVNFAFSQQFKEAIEAKQVAEQEAQKASFVAKQAAEEAKAEINRAKGKAEAQRLLQQTLTPEILQQQAIAKWNGQFPMVITGEGAAPLLNLDQAILNPK